MMETAAHALGCTVFPGGIGQTDQQVHTMADLAPAGYTGTPSFLKIIIEKADELGIALPSLRRALFSGEAVSGVWQRGSGDGGVRDVGARGAGGE